MAALRDDNSQIWQDVPESIGEEAVLSKRNSIFTSFPPSPRQAPGESSLDPKPPQAAAVHTAQQTPGSPQIAGTATDLLSSAGRENAREDTAGPQQQSSKKRQRFSDKPVWQAGLDWTGSGVAAFFTSKPTRSTYVKYKIKK